MKYLLKNGWLVEVDSEVKIYYAEDDFIINHREQGNLLEGQIKGDYLALANINPVYNLKIDTELKNLSIVSRWPKHEDSVNQRHSQVLPIEETEE